MKINQTIHPMLMMMNSRTYSIKSWTMLFTFVFVFSQLSLAQTLTISDGGQTGTSGTNWSVSGSNPITISATGGNADVNTSVLEGYLNAGTSVLLEGVVISVNNPLEKTAGGDASLTLRAAGTNTNSHGRVLLYSNITSSSGALDLILWSDYNHHNKGGVSVFSNNIINTNGGHFWAGGSASAQGSTTWNGLTVGDGPAVGSIGNNYNAFDFYDVNLNTGGGDVLLWAGQGYDGGTNGISFNGATGEINSGAGDVIIISDAFLGETNITSTGHLYLAPHDGAYPGAVDWNHNNASPNINVGGTFDALNINDFSNLGGLTIGKYEGMTGLDVSNTSITTINSNITIAGPISIHGNQVILFESLETTASEAAILLKSRGQGGSLTNGYIALTSNQSLATNGGDIILWSNVENVSSGTANNEIILAGENTLTSNGGQIVLAGGLDDGNNDGTANDGIPDGFAYRGGYASSAVDIRSNVSLLSGGGDVIIRGHSDPNLGSSNVVLRSFAVQAKDGFTLDSGLGTIHMNGLNHSDHAIWLGYYDNSLSTGPSSIAITSASSAEPAISIQGESNIAYSGLGLNWDASPNNSHVLIQSTANTGGGVSISGINSGMVAGTYGLIFGRLGTDQDIQILSQAGDVSIISNSALYLHGHDAYLGNRKDATPINGITPTPSNSSSNVLIRTDEIDESADGDMIVSTTGSLSIEPNVNWTTNFMVGNFLNLNGSFSNDNFTGSLEGDWLEVKGVSGLTGLTLGKDGATTSGLATHTDWEVNGPIQIFSGNGTVIQGSLSALSSGGDVLVKSNGRIEFSADASVLTNNGDIIVWADSDADQEGHITIGNNVSFNSVNGSTASGLSGGGHIVLSGGLDDGANDGTENDGIPDGYARSASNPGIALNSDNTGDVSFYSGGGDVIMRAFSANNSGTAAENNGINQYGALLINSGTGKISMLGEGVNQYGINLNQASTSDVLQLELISAATSGNAISIRGVSGSDIGLVFNFSSLKELKATDGGDIQLEGIAGGTSPGIFLQTLSVLANSGTITLDGGVNGIFNKSTGNTYGAKAGTAIEASSSNIIFRGNSISVEAGGTATSFNTSGTVTLEPSGDDFSNPLIFPIPNLTLDNAVSGLTLGKETSSADGTSDANVTIAQATSIAGPISIYGGVINIDANLTSTATGGNGILIHGQRIIQDNGIDVSTSGANIEYEAANFVATAGSDLLISLAGTGVDEAVLNANGGNITLNSSFGMGGVDGGSDRAIQTNNAAINTSGEGLISLLGEASANPNTGTSAWAMQSYSSKIQSADGDITIDMTGGASTSNSRGFVVDGGSSSILSNSGTIRMMDREPAGLTGNYSGLYLRPLAVGAIVFGADGSSVLSSSSDILIESDKITFDAIASNINSSGVISFRPLSESFANTLSTFFINIQSSASGLNLGKAGNTGDITHGVATSIAGPIHIYGGDIAINGVLSSSGDDINIVSNGTVSQSAALTANGLSLNGTGDFVLSNASNNVLSIAGGDDATALGNVTYLDADALALGTVGSQSGIIASGTIQVETENGDLSLSQNINTSSSANNAIVLNAGRAAAVGTETGGDIIVSGSPILTTGAGGISKLFSGTDANSTGLTTLVGEGNVRYDLDETSDLSGEGLAADNAYAIYRTVGNTPPTVTSTSITTATAESLYTYNIEALDAENDLITWTENTIPAWLTFTSGVVQTSFVGTGVNPTNTGDGVNQSEDGTSASSTAILTGTAAHGDGKLFFTDTEEYGIRYVDANGNVQTWYQGDGTFTNLNPTGIAYDAINDAVYVGDYATTDIVKIDNSGNLTLLSDLPEPFMLRLLVNSDGSMLYASARGGIYEIDLANSDPADNWTRVVGTGTMGYSDTGLASTSQVSQPHGMAFDSAGRLVFTDRFNDIIRRVDLTTNTIETIAGAQGANAEAGDGGIAVDATFADPSGLVINQQGEIFISERLSKRIRKIDANGNIDTFFTVAAGGFADDLVISDGGELFLLTTNLIAQVATVAELSGTPTNADAGVHDVSLTLSDGEFDVPYNFQITVIAINSAPSDITLDNNTINQSATGVDAAVGNLSTIDEDAGDAHTYTLVAGTGDTHNASFNIDASSLRTSSALSPGTYSVRINSNDGSDDFAKAFTIIVNDDVAPNPPSQADLADASDTCDSDNDDITTVTTPIFTGTAEANATIDLSSSIDGSIGTAVADEFGNWSITSTSLSQGTHSITATATDAASNTSSASTVLSLTITTLDDASFGYAAPAYCVSDADPSPEITGASGGNFASTAGLSISASTGTIDVSASTPGVYDVTYTSAGACPSNSVVSLIVNALDDASFNYSAAAYCVDASDPIPTISGLEGGAFSSAPAGLSINASTGSIDVSASIPGEYTVTYTSTGTCANSSSASVTINDLDDASFNYSAAEYCLDASDPSPTIAGLAGGTFSSTLGLDLNPSTGTIDVSASTPGVYTVTYTTTGECPNSSSTSVTINALDDASFNYSAAAYCVNSSNPTPTITGLAGGTFSSALGLELDPIIGSIDVSSSTPGVYTVSYTTSGVCANTSSASVTINALDDASFNYSAAAYCEDASDPTPTITGLAGGTFSSTPGLDINSTTGAIDVSTSTPGTYTVSYTTNGTCANSSEETVTINKLDDAVFAYASAAYCEDALDPLPMISGTDGGTFSSTPGLEINSLTGAIDISASIPGEYTVTYTTLGVCPNSAAENVSINVLDDASFNYSAAAYCEDASDPTPTITGSAGGTFSSTLGLDLNPSTGTINLSASIPGEYTVTYTTAGACTNSSSASVIINALDDASFNYAAVAFCLDASDPSPTITGLAGGTFSSTLGLELDPSTGAIDVAASTPGVYTVSYTTTGACANSTSVGVTINALGDTSFAYDNSTFDISGSDPLPTILGDAGGGFSSSMGLSIDSNTGLIDLSESTPGTYIVTYTTSRPCINSSTFELTIIDTSSIAEANLDLSALALYPNPASSVLHIANPNQIALQSISIYDLHGRLVKEIPLENNVFNPSIDIALFESAFYVVKITTQDARQIAVRFTKI